MPSTEHSVIAPFFPSPFQSCLMSSVVSSPSTLLKMEMMGVGVGRGGRGSVLLYLYFVLQFPPFKSGAVRTAVYFEPALHAQPRMLCTTILWHAIQPRGGVAYVLGLGGGHIEFEDFVFPLPTPTFYLHPIESPCKYCVFGTPGRPDLLQPAFSSEQPCAVHGRLSQQQQRCV